MNLGWSLYINGSVSTSVVLCDGNDMELRQVPKVYADTVGVAVLDQVAASQLDMCKSAQVPQYT